MKQESLVDINLGGNSEMQNRKNILFIVPSQYGYNTGYFYYCELLAKEQYNVFYIGTDQQKPIIKSNFGVNVICINDGNQRLGRWRLKIAKVSWKLNAEVKFDKIIIHGYNFCSLLLLIFSRKSCVMDIRTSYITTSILKTFINNVILYIDSLMFWRVSIISRSLGRFMRISPKKSYLLPIGALVEDYVAPQFNEFLSLLYVGTFYDRNIEKTIEGVALFKNRHPEVSIQYTIIGMGSEKEKELIQSAIKEHYLDNIVEFVGEKRYEMLKPYYHSHNIGVSYVPLTKYYDCQPPTKTFEYLVKGMLVMCTPTSENAILTHNENGVLLESDSVEDFAKGIEYIHNNRANYINRKIYNDSRKYSWENIVKKYLCPIVDTF